MKDFSFLLAFVILGTPNLALANVCQVAMQEFVDQQNALAEAEYHDPKLITPQEAIDLVESNNTDLSEDEMNRILVPALREDPNIEFYLIDIDSMGGSGTDLLAVNVIDCSVKTRLGIFAD